MHCLLDTHTLIWFLNGDDKLSPKAKNTIEDPENSNFISVATVWELAIKLSLDKIKFQNGFKKFLDLLDDNGFDIIPISFDHVLTVSSLEFIHRDPFDRLIVAQSITEDFIIITKDEYIRKYNVRTIW